MKSYPYRTTEERWRRLRATAGSRDLSVKEALDTAVDNYVKTYNLYDQASARAAALFPYDLQAREFCLADWPEGDEHWRWLATAPEAEIRDWVAVGLRDAEAGPVEN